MKKKICILINLSLMMGVLLMLTSSCKKKSIPELPKLPEISVVNISQESDWDYWVVGKKDYYYLKTENSLPKSVLFHSSEANKDYSIFFTDDGRIDKVAVDNYIFILRNFKGNKVDIGIIDPKGNIEILREVATDYDWTNLTQKSAGISSNESVIRWTGRVVAGVPCLLSVLEASGTGGALAPLAFWKCGNYLLKLSNDIATNEFDIHNGITNFINSYGDALLVYNCSGADPTGCLIGLSSRGYSQMANNLNQIEGTRSGDVQTTEAALGYGYGDVQATLIWNNNADLDLHVIDPSGEEIWWHNKYSYSGGILDVDDINGYGPENIYWPQGEATNGNYEVYIHYYKWPNETWRPSTSNYTVLLTAFGRIKKFSGSIALDETIHIQDFDQNGLKSATVEKSFTISKLKK